MFGIIGFFFLIILIVLIFALVIVSNILSGVLRIFGIGKRRSRKKETYTKNENSQYNSTSSDYNRDYNRDDNSTTHEHKGKIIGKDEGEYIDFEEIK